ncbi:hypothetical protein SDC9_103828 [bioreactor metagenome]|uniref:Uncharacterized protein n=1 Tax=bioreactor metagenome TaxID=1076179 RepID=A0A645AXI7_9ZZZZ
MLAVVLGHVDQRRSRADGLDHRVPQCLRLAHGGDYAAVVVLVRAVIQQLYMFLRPKGARDLLHLFKVPPLTEVWDTLHDLIQVFSLLYSSRGFHGALFIPRLHIFFHHLYNSKKSLVPQPFFRELFAAQVSFDANSTQSVYNPICKATRTHGAQRIGSGGGHFRKLMRCLNS